MTSVGYGKSELLKTWDYDYVVKSWLRAGDSYLNLFELQFPHLLKKMQIINLFFKSLVLGTKAE